MQKWYCGKQRAAVKSFKGILRRRSTPCGAISKVCFITMLYYQHVEPLISTVNKLSNALRQNRPELVNCKGVVFHHVTKTQQKWLNIDLKILKSHYRCTRHGVIRSIVPATAKFLNGEIFADEWTVKSHLENIFDIKS